MTVRDLSKSAGWPRRTMGRKVVTVSGCPLGVLGGVRVPDAAET
jgi:hypothetical protein